MRTTIVSVCLAAAVCVLPAWVFAADVKRVAPEDFAILPWGGTNPDPAVLKEIADCGFNLAGFVRPEGLDAVKAAGLKCIVSGHNTHVGDAEAGLDEGEIAKRVEPLVRQASKHPAVFGYYLRDEPTAHRFPGLAKWVSVYRRFDPDARCYINLFPNVASIPQLGVKTYDEYVESFVTTVKPSFIMVVNKDLHTSALLGIRFKQDGRVMHTNSYTGATHPWDGEDRWFAAGQGMLLSLAK